MTERTPDTPPTPFYAEMREQILDTPLPVQHGVRAVLRRLSPEARSPRMQLGLLSGASLALAAIVAAIVLALGATTSAPPAYALTRHADGSVTITLSNLTTGIPALNAKLREQKIDETVIPIKSDCHLPQGTNVLVMHPNPMFEDSGSVSTTYTPQAAQKHPAAPGYHYVLAAKRLPNGKLLAFIGALKAPIPACLPYSSAPSTVLP